MTGPSPSQTLVRSYLFLRRAIGFIGMALPFVLIVAGAATSGTVLSSISAYYYSGLRNVFVGCMFAVAVFLIFYRGFRRIDDVSSTIAGVAALGVALCPTRPSEAFTRADEVIGLLHIVCAGVFFLTLAGICALLFSVREKDPAGKDRKRARNTVYVTCGVVIVTCLGLMVLFGSILEEQARSMRPALWLESVAIFAFGVAWMIKGNTLLCDRPIKGNDQATRVTVGV